MSQLDLPQIAESQALAYVTSNDADARLEKALCEEVSDHDATAGDFAISTEDFQGAWHQVIGGAPAAAFTVTVPALQRPFMVTNNSGETATIQTGSGNAGQVLETETRLFYCDGSNVLALSDQSVDGGEAGSQAGVLVHKTADETVANNTALVLNWEDAAYDTDDFHDPLVNGSRLTIPSGITKVQLTAQIRWDSSSVNLREVQFYKNGSNAYTGRAFSRIEAVSGATLQTLVSPVLVVTAGDYLEVAAWQNSGSSRTVLTHDSCWFGLQVIG